MRKSLITIGLAAASVAAVAALAGCGTAAASHARPAAPDGTSASAPAAGLPTAADGVLARGYFAGGYELTLPPGMAGIASVAYGFNGNAEEVAVVYDTPARAAAAVTWYQGQRDSLGMVDGQIIICQGPQGAPATVVTIFGDDVRMAQFVKQISGANA
jgi:hypothetical protein